MGSLSTMAPIWRSVDNKAGETVPAFPRYSHAATVAKAPISERPDRQRQNDSDQQHGDDAKCVSRKFVDGSVGKSGENGITATASSQHTVACTCISRITCFGRNSISGTDDRSTQELPFAVNTRHEFLEKKKTNIDDGARSFKAQHSSRRFQVESTLGCHERVCSPECIFKACSFITHAVKHMQIDTSHEDITSIS